MFENRLFQQNPFYDAFLFLKTTLDKTKKMLLIIKMSIETALQYYGIPRRLCFGLFVQ